MNVLLIEPDKARQELILRATAGNYDIECASDAREAEQLMSMRFFDCCILGWSQPGDEAVNIWRVCANAAPGIPVVLFYDRFDDHVRRLKKQGVVTISADAVSELGQLRECLSRSVKWGITKHWAKSQIGALKILVTSATTI